MYNLNVKHFKGEILKMKIISARITDCEYRKLKFYCEMHGGSISEWIRAHLESTLRQAEAEEPNIWEDMVDMELYHEQMRERYLK